MLDNRTPLAVFTFRDIDAHGAHNQVVLVRGAFDVRDHGQLQLSDDQHARWKGGGLRFRHASHHAEGAPSLLLRNADGGDRVFLGRADGACFSASRTGASEVYVFDTPNLVVVATITDSTGFAYRSTCAIREARLHADGRELDLIWQAELPIFPDGVQELAVQLHEVGAPLTQRLPGLAWAS